MTAPLRIAFAVVLLGVAGCTSEASKTPPPASCNPDARVGTYKFTYVQQSGNCGPIDAQLVSLNPGPGGAGAGCTLNSERLSEGGCKIERDVSCTGPDANGRTVAVTRALTSDAAEITGTMTMTLTGNPSCSSTYAIDAVRQ